MGCSTVVVARCNDRLARADGWTTACMYGALGLFFVVPSSEIGVVLGMVLEVCLACGLACGPFFFCLAAFPTGLWARSIVTPKRGRFTAVTPKWAGIGRATYLLCLLRGLGQASFVLRRPQAPQEFSCFPLHDSDETCPRVTAFLLAVRTATACVRICCSTCAVFA